ncbi:MAG: RloB domain-containing protein [Clostridia bacterium]|jgi:hypothetical protein|nr:RloB domain-containing protein [Clostridia bacterium]MBT7121388.1 RloB domain-containing protein [Clostridia bacterium]
MRKLSKQFFISVPGETEQWYFEYLQSLTYRDDRAKFVAKISSKKYTSPRKHVRALPVLSDDIRASHICDYESNDGQHVTAFKGVMDEAKEIRDNCGTSRCIADYTLGYSNFTFDLWMVLHKATGCAPVSHRRQYIGHINDAFGTDYSFIDDYKKEDNFKKILSQIELDDVLQAVINAEKIRSYNLENKRQWHRQYKGFEYNLKNPDLTINEVVKRILSECGVIE